MTHRPAAKAAPTAERPPRKLPPTVPALGPAAPGGAAPPGGAGLWQQVLAYQIDRMQRSVLVLDTLRERANNLLAHEAAGMPPLLDFDYETVLDARRFDRPANYALLAITRCRNEHARDQAKPGKAPVIVVDPRAGHGPGIGGFKHDSEVGVALHHGHPTYFVVFFPLPCEGQTLADVLAALRRFVEEVTARHGGTPPVLYGNCQAGWAVTLLAAACEGTAGPTVLNGSPLSYWAGESDVNPMRLSGGLLGGAWMAHFLADLGNGRLDGAWLVQNFENLNPTNALWQKYYHLFANVDTERERFLAFERWWNGYYFLSREEILSIVENLFVGNKLERGKLRVDDCCFIDLTRIRSPLLIFASSGDNITPPHQALNWIPTVYPDTAALKRAGQRIVYLLNTHVGHLGIFVSSEVAKLEHRAILENIGRLDALAPGLYEMIIERQDGADSGGELVARFEERAIEQIRYNAPGKSFEKVQELSERNELLYRHIASPWISAFANPLSAQVLKWLHPMRLSKLVYSEKLFPWMMPVAAMADAVRSSRVQMAEPNALAEWEQQANRVAEHVLDGYRQVRDAWSEQLFRLLYGDK